MTDGVQSTALKLKVATLDNDATRVLPLPELVVQLEGQLHREKNDRLVLERAIFRVTLLV